MVLLTSNGLSSRSLLEEVGKQLPSREKRAAMITTASVGYKDRDWHVPKLTAQLESLGLSVDCFDLDTQESELLKAYDLIEIIGGNPFYLLRQMKCAACGDFFRDFAEGKIIVGISAGSIVLQKDIRLVAGFSPELNEEVGLTDLSGLHLTDVEILPHYHRMLSEIPNLEERTAEYERKHACKVIRLDDGQGILTGRETSHVLIK
ncbi:MULTISPECIES: Type 1 glutamine amidotransferase-like domain-containing protein [Acutalibacteraceae]|uniref:Type 1 glutamine amidotransferase-like domain-containing protein n=1 Tax=Acutalibacteraceae TaxID=3082771 RepID=UPI0013E8AD13|nr:MULTISPECIES: Type 1 glutamine amidotransferase-like domain-containing protein [Acutalibacteraceae]